MDIILAYAALATTLPMFIQLFISVMMVGGVVLAPMLPIMDSMESYLLTTTMPTMESEYTDEVTDGLDEYEEYIRTQQMTDIEEASFYVRWMGSFYHPSYATKKAAAYSMAVNLEKKAIAKPLHVQQRMQRRLLVQEPSLEYMVQNSRKASIRYTGLKMRRLQRMLEERAEVENKLKAMPRIITDEVLADNWYVAVYADMCGAKHYHSSHVMDLPDESKMRLQHRSN